MKLILLSLLLIQQQAPTTQQQQTPPTGSIEGTVVRIGTGEPIAGARVILTKSVAGLPTTIGGVPVLPPVSGATIVSSGSFGARPVQPTTVPTDAQGRFVATNVEAGGYRITVAANGYARQDYGQKAFGTPGTIVNVAAGQPLKDIVVRMTPAGNVTGRISDDSGRPAVGAQVQLLRTNYGPNGQKLFQAAGTTRTNDRGEYRLYWVTPGKYYLSASSGSGPTRPVDGGTGESPNGLSESYALTYYPGAADLKDASSIEVQAGVELSAIDFNVPVQQLRKVRGRVIDSRTGQRPAAANLSIASRSLTGGGFTSGAFSAYNPADGTFEIANVAPGSYTITAQIQDPNQRITPLPSSAPDRPSASAPVTVASTDVDGVVLNIVAPVSIPGRLVVEGQQLSSVQGFERIRVQLSQPNNEPFSSTPQFQTLNSDGSFREDNALPGQYRLSVLLMPPDFYIKEALFDQTDVLNKLLAFNGSVPTPLDIVLSPKAGQIEGTLMNDRHEPAAAIQVVLIPDLHRERTDLYKTSLSAANGKFNMRGITPGDYKLFAWESVELFAYYDSDFVQKYESQGKPVHITESGKLTVEVSAIKD
jgi:hypothetical protein